MKRAKQYQFDTRIPKMFFTCKEVIYGEFMAQHNYPNLKMNNKAIFKEKKKETKEDEN